MKGLVARCVYVWSTNEHAEKMQEYHKSQAALRLQEHHHRNVIGRVGLILQARRSLTKPLCF